MTDKPTSEHRDEAGRFLPGNRFWEARSTAGPKPKFKTAEALWAVCCEYFEWVEANPLYEAKAFHNSGAVVTAHLPKMRAMTLSGLCNFLDVDETTWRDWRENRSDLSPLTTRVEQFIRQQKFEGASADLLNPNIIARDLGLADRREHSGPDGGPIQTEDAADAFTRRIASLAARLGETGGDGPAQ